MSFVAVAIGAGGAIIGGIASASAGTKAANATRDASNANTQLAKDNYAANSAVLAPYVGAGNSATNSIQALLGLAPSGGYTAPQYQQGGFVGTPLGGREDFKVSDGLGGLFGALGRSALQKGGYQFPNDPAAQFTYGPATTQQSANDAFAQYRNSTGYDFRTSEGNKALTASLGRNSMLDSGAAVKSAIKYNQNAASDEFSRYLAALQNQQNIGVTAASAQAGVGNSLVNNVSANNNNAANAAGNAAINTSNSINGVLGNLTSSAALYSGMKSSYAPKSGSSGFGADIFG